MMEAKQAAERLLQADNILVISHASPDGDTLGSASALMRGLLQKLAKSCSPIRYSAPRRIFSTSGACSSTYTYFLSKTGLVAPT